MLVSGRVDLYFCTGWSVVILRQVQLDHPCTGLVACEDRGDRKRILGGTHEIRVIKDVWIFVDDVYIPGTCECPLFWGASTSTLQKKAISLQSKQGSIRFQVYMVYISSKTPRFWTTPGSCLFQISFRCLRTKLQPSDQNWSLYVDQDSGDNNYHIFTYIYLTNNPNVGKYTIHGSSGICIYNVFIYAHLFELIKFRNQSFWTLAISLIDWPHGCI